jgi:hypothetical protein
MRKRQIQLVLAFAFVAGTVGHEAVAAVCFPFAGGVPGQGGSGPPDWWSAGASPTGSTTSSFLDDPRWRGALSDMVMTNERFRVVVENTGGSQFLVMSWEVSGDATGTGDNLYFGVWDDVSGSSNIYRLTRETAVATPVPAGTRFSSVPPAFSGRIFKSAGALGSVTWSGTSAGPAPYALPTWLTNDARVDVKCAGTLCDRWAFRIRAKIDPTANPADPTPNGIKISSAVLPAAPTFRFWYEVQDSSSIGTTLYSFPAGLSPASEAGATPSFPDPSGWRQAQLGSGASCDGDILFDGSDVYVNSVGSSQLSFTSNTFHATPKNNVPTATRPSIPNNALQARYRIANWGSAGYNSPEWKDTCMSSGAVGTAVLSGNDFDLSCLWTLTAAQACPYRPAGDPCGATAGTKDRHQCILVDLEDLSGLNHFVFSAKSVYANMNFDVNSTLVRQATVDIKGLGPMPSGATARDVFLYIHTANLPARIADEPPAPGDQGGIPPARQRFKQLELPATGAIGTQASARIQAALQAGQLTVDQVEQLMPTYTVYVWHDTGRTLATAAGPSKILEAQPSFGLFLAHDGALEGWKHQLTASGAVLVGPNLYKLSTPNDGAFPVTITIQPIEPIRPLSVIPMWLWILLVLLLLVIIVYVASRRRSPT